MFEDDFYDDPEYREYVQNLKNLRNDMMDILRDHRDSLNIVHTQHCLRCYAERRMEEAGLTHTHIGNRTEFPHQHEAVARAYDDTPDDWTISMRNLLDLEP